MKSEAIEKDKKQVSQMQAKHIHTHLQRLTNMNPKAFEKEKKTQASQMQALHTHTLGDKFFFASMMM